MKSRFFAPKLRPVLGRKLESIITLPAGMSGRFTTQTMSRSVWTSARRWGCLRWQALSLLMEVTSHRAVKSCMLVSARADARILATIHSGRDALYAARTEVRSNRPRALHRPSATEARQREGSEAPDCNQ